MNSRPEPFLLKSERIPYRLSCPSCSGCLLFRLQCASGGWHIAAPTGRWGRYVRAVAGTLVGLRGCLVRGVACLLGFGFVMCPPGRYVRVVAGTLWLCGALGWWWGSESGCFLRLLVFGIVGGLAMCEWWLAHRGLFGCSLVWVVGGSGLFAGFGILVFSVGSLCASGGWHIGGSEGWFGPGSGLFAGFWFVVCPSGPLCASGGCHIAAPTGDGAEMC
jgi:hypothetical protein